MFPKANMCSNYLNIANIERKNYLHKIQKLHFQYTPNSKKLCELYNKLITLDKFIDYNNSNLELKLQLWYDTYDEYIYYYSTSFDLCNLFFNYYK